MPHLTYDENNFFIDGEKTTILSGAIHYFRVVPEYWENSLKKLKACGFNTVETYTCWNLHEKKEGEFDFSGILDVAKFIETAQNLGLYVILRPGPYICAEFDGGGLPSWLLADNSIRLRCYDEKYLSKVRAYFKELLSRVSKYFSGNGGNIIATQIENEYGSYGNDKKYLEEVVKIYEENNVNTPYFTSDGPTYFMLNGGTLPNYLATANFGSAAKEKFDFLKNFAPNQPVLCGEFWNGWFDHWFEDHHRRPDDEVIACFKEMLDYNGSVNFYMFQGGTNFGFNNGANFSDEYQPTITSYDLDAPLSECGDRTNMYYGMKKLVEEYFGPVPEIEIEENKRFAYGNVELTECANLLECAKEVSDRTELCQFTKSMEELGQNFGFVLYKTTITGPYEKLPLTINGLHDRAHIYINGELKAIRYRNDKDFEPLLIELAKDQTITLEILVENMGRINYGNKLRDKKGIIDGVYIGQQCHFGWEMESISCEDLSRISYKSVTDQKEFEGSTYFKGSFEAETLADTWLRLDGFTKGVAFINGFNLGRYWNTAGPQKTLYIPAPVLKVGKNELVILELDKTTSTTAVLTDIPDLG